MTKIQALSTGIYNDPFEILFKNFFDSTTKFESITTRMIDYPIDVYEDDNKLFIDIAVVGLTENDIDIKIEQNNVLRISYINKEESASSRKYLHKSIARRKFNFGWKLDSKYDVTQLTATMEKGLLTIVIPFATTAEPIKININKSIN